MTPSSGQRRERATGAAWAAEDGTGAWSVDWQVPEAVEYALYRAPCDGNRKEPPTPVGQAPRAADLTLDGPPQAHEYWVRAKDAKGRLLALSAVGTDDPAEPADMNAMIAKWTKWPDLAPHDPDKKEKIGEAKVDTVNGRIRTTQKYRATKTPEAIVTFNPNVNMVFPGAIVQALPAINQGYLEPAGVEDSDRADLGVTVDALVGRKETASPPTASNVLAAIGKVVGDGSPGSSDIVYRRVEGYTSMEVALELGISGKYGGFAASLDVEGKRKESQNTILVYLRERAFTAFCDMSTPKALFKPSFTKQKLNELVSRGKMGPQNPPLLVSSVIYGRILTFTLTSKETETEINAALKASYEGFGSGFSAELKARYQAIIRNSEISIVGLNVTPETIKGLLVDGKLNAYFSTKPPFKSYKPIGHTLHTLDGVPAKMSETTEYDAVSWAPAQVTLKFNKIRLPDMSEHDLDSITLDKGATITEKPLTAKRPYVKDAVICVITGAQAGDDHYIGETPLTTNGWFADGSNTYNGQVNMMHLEDLLLYTAER
ncbi:thiol-activated cytolysin family protein [Streptomyces sp. NPDC018019]|uniref:thiol-activated cytolysin family protein n=1 Tax=Streptomyces sp. NPDC018019 TaxID=3365030 RepID=UPI0037ABE026